MTPDTPLTEVAAHLPAETAALLLEHEPEVQSAVLTQVRAVVVFWETQRYVFDPIAYEGILRAFVPTLAPLYAEVLRLERERGRDRDRLQGAEVLLAALNHRIAEMSREAGES